MGFSEGYTRSPYTPVSLCGALIGRFPQRRRPSLVSHRLGVHVTFFEACSAFTQVMTCTLADRLAITEGLARSSCPLRTLRLP
jgi:hypothetical protein